MPADLPPPFICIVVKVHDGDTLTCKTGEKVRLAAIDTNELDGTCHTNCAKQSAREARNTLAWLIGGKVDESRSVRRSGQVSREKLVLANAPVVRFAVVGRSGKRLVGDNMTLRCRMVAAGAAVPLERYRARYNLRRCR